MAKWKIFTTTNDRAYWCIKSEHKSAVKCHICFKKFNDSENRKGFFSIHYLTSIDIYDFLVIFIDNIVIKIDGMVYTKNNITEYL